MTRRSVGTVLLTGLTLVACARAPQPITEGKPSAGAVNPYAGGVSYPWRDRVDIAPAGSNPYADGTRYPWTGPVGSANLGRLASTDNFLSDLDWTSAKNAWGPIEKDRSNGEQGPADGKPLTIGGQVYAKGLGVHAGSEVQYTLGGYCTTFTAQVGIDDEVGNLGSVNFQLWNGAIKLYDSYDSGVLRGSDSARAVSVNISGVQTLRLVVTDGGDNIDYDHADWGDAKVSCESSSPPAGETQLSDLGWQSASNGWGPVERNQSNGEQGAGDGKPLTIGGQVYAKGLGVHAGSVVQYTLGANCTTFTAQVGLDDEVGNLGSVNFQLYSGNSTQPFYDSGVRRGSDSAKAVSVNVSGVQTLRLVVTDSGDNIDYDHADWGDAKVTCGNVPSGFGTVLDYKDMTAQPYGVSEAQGVALNNQLYVFGGFDVLKGFTPTSRAYRYDLAQNIWTMLAAMPAGGVTNAGITTDGRFIYYAGGNTPDSSGNGQVFGSRRVYRYDPFSDSYSRLPDLPADLGAGQLQQVGGKLHSFGGLDATRTIDLASHHVLSLTEANATWTPAAPLPQPRNNLGSAVLNGKIYAIGGQTGIDAGLVTHSSVYAYDPGTDAWSTLSSLPFGRGHISNSTFVMAGRVVVVGGETGHVVPVSDVSAYDPVTNSWQALTPLPERRASAVAAATDNQHIYITSGINPAAQFQAGGWQASLR
ncbi:NPCBM/NEW2 domain-containing protein [Deinococcus sp.]|uniref:NPCBM/NEW2 domain-containing protein n=1 Tax=Deinococcus sp. TaxID=47478 RepID=UPI00286DF38C|nr:NPCBM/NEW2 domain-containing protein [Deinococcus sp.]